MTTTTTRLSFSMRLVLRDIAAASPGGWVPSYHHDQGGVNALVRRGLVERDDMWMVRLTEAGRQAATEKGDGNG